MAGRLTPSTFVILYTARMQIFAHLGRFVTAEVRRSYAWTCERLYHELAWSYDWVSWIVSAGAWATWRQVVLRAIVDDETPLAAPLLEIGFGTGALLHAAAQAELPIVGLELSPTMHAVANARLIGKELAPPRVQATALVMPFQAASFGAVLATFPAGYILAPATLRECARVLTEDGRLIIAGLWVAPVVAGRRLQLPPLYGAPTRTQVDAITGRIATAGFRVTTQMHYAGGAEIAVIVAHKQPNMKGATLCGF